MRYLLLILTLLCEPLAAKTIDAVFAGGCFWCVEADFEKLPGVLTVISGYDGGTEPNPSYETVASGTTHYVESVRVSYDSDKISYSQLLDYFWHHIDPTTKDGQFCDIGRQYRTIIFYSNDEQKQAALNSKANLNKQFPTIYTDILPSTHFYPAEAYHQDYYKKNPLRYKYYRYRCGRDQRIQEIWNETSH